MKRGILLLLVLSAFAAGQALAPRTRYQVKYVAEGVVYLDGGRNEGLSEGMKLSIRRDPEASAEAVPGTLAELEVTSVAAASAACEIRSLQGTIRPGDSANLSAEDAQLIQAVKSSETGRKYAQVVTFTEGDPLEEEQRAEVPRPRSPEVNRARGRIGFEYNTIRQGGGAGQSSQFGLYFRGDVARIGDSYWNLSGYWRGRLNMRDSGVRQDTITDLLNRTYHVTLFYNNPQSRWVAGVGRLYLPWAASLDTIDGGYAGRRLGRSFTVGAFGGSTPDPTSWNYKPDRQLLGTFANYASGSFESVHITSTAGLAASRLSWRPERQFAFFENGLFYKRILSIYHNAEVDQVKHQAAASDNGVKLSRSFATLRIQPVKILSLDFNHNYFRNIPTFDPRLVGTGLVDRLLFQGATMGFRLDLPFQSTVYANFGRSTRSGDARRSLNQLYGLTKSNVFRTGLRADVRYSKFDGSFGSGSYRALSLSREIGDAFRMEFQAGDQRLTSAFTNQGRSRFVTASGDWYFSRHYFLGGGYTLYRSMVQDYDQVYLNLGYRF